MYKPENIKDLIKTNEAPYFNLKAKDNPYAKERFLFSNKKVKDVDVVTALKMFDQQLEMHAASPDQIFIIELSSSASGAHGSGILGPFEFKINGVTTSQTFHQPNMQGIGGLEVEMQSAVGSLGALYAKRDELIREQGKLDMERALFERDKREFEVNKQKELSELSGLKEKFESNSERIKHGAEKAFMKLYDAFMETTDEKEKETIGAVVVEEPATQEEKAIEAIGEEIIEALDAGKVNMSVIQQISAAVKQILNNL